AGEAVGSTHSAPARPAARNTRPAECNSGIARRSGGFGADGIMASYRMENGEANSAPIPQTTW
ncbi:MAG TPA: hypothetical protein PKZ77_07740, partial [Pseudomonadales bacterium]|nr:hypothetical protein [Pseudomonadales bacterium]